MPLFARRRPGSGHGEAPLAMPWSSPQPESSWNVPRQATPSSW